MNEVGCLLSLGALVLLILAGRRLLYLGTTPSAQKMGTAVKLEVYLKAILEEKPHLREDILHEMRTRLAENMLEELPPHVRSFRWNDVLAERTEGTVNWTVEAVRNHIRALRAEAENLK